MGGFGSGRHGGRKCTDEMRPLDVRKIARAGLLSPGRSFGWQWTCNDEVIASIRVAVDDGRVFLDYRQRSDGGDWEPMRYPVQLGWTSCNFGGKRPWWYCPVVRCQRRVAVLYGGRVFACRHCHGLSYRCQREVSDDRACRRAEAIRRRLDWEPGILNGNGCKLKGMHWRTFDGMALEHDAYVNVALAGMLARLGLLRDEI